MAVRASIIGKYCLISLHADKHLLHVELDPAAYKKDCHRFEAKHVLFVFRRNRLSWTSNRVGATTYRDDNEDDVQSLHYTATTSELDFSWRFALSTVNLAKVLQAFKRLLVNN